MSDSDRTAVISVVTVNWTETKTTMFCYLRASSPRCCRLKTARFLCIFIFLSVYYIYCF